MLPLHKELLPLLLSSKNVIKGNTEDVDDQTEQSICDALVLLYYIVAVVSILPFHFTVSNGCVIMCDHFLNFFDVVIINGEVIKNRPGKFGVGASKLGQYLTYLPEKHPIGYYSLFNYRHIASATVSTLA